MRDAREDSPNKPAFTARQLGWFVLIWLASVGTLGLVALGLRLWIA